DPTMGDGTGVQNYAGNLRVFADRGVAAAYDEVLPKPGAVDPGSASIPRTFADGTSNTILFATRLSICGAGGSRYAASPQSPYGAYFGEEPATRSAHAYLPGVTFQLAPTVSNCIDKPFMAQSFNSYGIQ